jgi:hypothetical protein
MRVPQYAMRRLAALALIGLMTGCGGDSNAPDAPFDPAGTSSDLGAIDASFESEAMYGFQTALPAIGEVLGETAAGMAVRAAPSKVLAAGKSGAREYAGTLSQLNGQPSIGMRPVAPRAAILEEHLGVTFTLNPETLEYEASDRTGAPSNGVRFIVYAVNPVNGQPVTPLNEVGYADIEVSGTETAGTVRFELVSGDVTYLDYTFAFTFNPAFTFTVSGFVTNGEDRVNFDLDMQGDDNGFTIDYTLSVPTRGNFRLDLELEFNVANSTMTSNLEVRGPHGTITIVGTQTQTGGTYEVEVNGDEFATITSSQSSGTVITGADGGSLTNEELEALQEMSLFLGGLYFFGLPIPIT